MGTQHMRTKTCKIHNLWQQHYKIINHNTTIDLFLNTAVQGSAILKQNRSLKRSVAIDTHYIHCSPMATDRFKGHFCLVAQAPYLVGIRLNSSGPHGLQRMPTWCSPVTAIEANAVQACLTSHFSARPSGVTQWQKMSSARIPWKMFTLHPLNCFRINFIYCIFLTWLISK